MAAEALEVAARVEAALGSEQTEEVGMVLAQVVELAAAAAAYAAREMAGLAMAVG